MQHIWKHWKKIGKPPTKTNVLLCQNRKCLPTIEKVNNVVMRKCNNKIWEKRFVVVD